MTTQAIVAHHTGSPEVFSFEKIELKTLAPDEVIVQHHAIGVNFIDTYFRSGVYPWKGEMPIIVGAEASGEVIEIGSAVADLQVGDRVAYVSGSGAYAQHRVMPAERLVKLPDYMSHNLAAAGLLKGLTVHYLLHRTFEVKPGHKILFHAAAGGVGRLAGQWARHLGATLIGTVGSAEKAALAKRNGYRHTINYREENFVEKVMEITNGEGVDVVYDSVGQGTYPHSLKCLKRLGMWVPFGQSSGLIKNFDLGHLAQHGSLFTTRPSLFDYIATKEELEKATEKLFGMIHQGFLRVPAEQKFKLEEAAKVHELLEGRKTKGSTILLP